MEIEKSITLPAKSKNPQRATEYNGTIKSMSNGDSVWFPSVGSSHKFQNAFYLLKKNGEINTRMVRRKVGESDNKGAGYRIWVLSGVSEGNDI